jgi:two-component system, response regulator
MSFQCTILLVEDNAADAALTLRAFKKNGLTNKVIHAKNGVEALEYLFGANPETRERPGLVLLDLNMPLIDGHEVLVRIRSEASTKLLPVVVLTSSTEHADLQRAYHNGANSYLKKPVVFTEFVETVRQVGAYWLMLNQPPPEET